MVYFHLEVALLRVYVFWKRTAAYRRNINLSSSSRLWLMMKKIRTSYGTVDGQIACSVDDDINWVSDSFEKYAYERNYFSVVLSERRMIKNYISRCALLLVMLN